ncbi:MAG: hypothetical protein AB7P78_01200 [Candidatus Binatia bacterium]
MAKDQLATYLNDHLAGSVVAIELMEHLEAVHAHSPIGRAVGEVRGEVIADRQALESLMTHLQIPESRTRKATAWVTEKLTELKLRVDDPAAGALRLLEALEAISLGIEGKRSLWLALSAASEGTPALATLDYERLIRRAEEQRSIIEVMRIGAARAALCL